MAITAFAPLGISWWIVLADDSILARTILKGAISSAGMGPFMLLWVGLASQLMAAKSGKKLLTANWAVWMFGGILYPVMNILLIVMHYHLAPIMFAWIDTAPLDKNAAIDNVAPWSQPEGWMKVVEPVVDEEEEVEPEDEEEEEDEDEDEEDDEAF